MNNSSNTLWQTGRGGLEKINLTTESGASAEIYRHGAHLTAWRTAAGKEWIFTSEQAQFTQGKAIRGGVPIIFPQFNAFGSGPRHGFARTSSWQLNEAPSGDGHRSRCVFSLSDNEQTQSVWPHRFAAQFIVELTDQQLRMTLSVRNCDDKPFEFTAALHSYFAIADLPNTRLQGLQGLSFWDNDGSDFSKRQTSAEDELTFSDAIDRVYFNSTHPLTLRDGSSPLQISSEGFKEVVVWNPGAQAAQTMADMADNEYRQMLCVEAAVIDQPVTVKPGQSWQGSQILTA